ncbi:unnamed protein product [Rhizophagus irregularis]|nr:unnamed protein product [Rhizophagus irregularis]
MMISNFSISAHWPWKLRLTLIFPKHQNKYLDSQNVMPLMHGNWEKAKNIGKKDKLNESGNMDRYFKSPYQQIKQLKQNKQQSKKNNITNSQEDQRVEFGDTLLELDSVQPET